MEAVAKGFPYVSLQKRKPQFVDGTFVWMSNNKTLNNRLNGLHEETLKLVYDDLQSSDKNFLMTS